LHSTPPLGGLPSE